MGIQEMKVSRVKVVKLIHGYDSTGRGGKIRIGIRNELATMQRRGLIKDYIPGEEFGPLDGVTRKLTDQDKSISREADFGRMNHGRLTGLTELLDWAAFSFGLFCCCGGNGSARPGSRDPNAPRDGISVVPEVPRRGTHETPIGNIIALRGTREGRDSHCILPG